MRRFYVTAIVIAAFASAGIGEGRTEDTPTPPNLQQNLDPDQSYADVVVLEFDALPPMAKQEIEKIVDDTPAPVLKELQSAVGESQQAVLTLASIGMDPTHVVAAGVSPEGILTLVVQYMA